MVINNQLNSILLQKLKNKKHKCSLKSISNLVTDNEFVKFMLTHESYPGDELDNKWKEQASFLTKIL